MTIDLNLAQVKDLEAHTHELRVRDDRMISDDAEHLTVASKIYKLVQATIKAIPAYQEGVLTLSECFNDDSMVLVHK